MLCASQRKRPQLLTGGGDLRHRTPTLTLTRPRRSPRRLRRRAGPHGGRTIHRTSVAVLVALTVET